MAYEGHRIRQHNGIKRDLWGDSSIMTQVANKANIKTQYKPKYV